MEGFNAPGSNKSWMDEGFKKFIVEHQLGNVVNILDAEIKRCRVYNSDNRDEVHHQITITYRQNK